MIAVSWVSRRLSGIQSTGRWRPVCIITVHLSIIGDVAFDLVFGDQFTWVLSSTTLILDCMIPRGLDISAHSGAPLDSQGILRFWDASRGHGGLSRTLHIFLGYSQMYATHSITSSLCWIWGTLTGLAQLPMCTQPSLLSSLFVVVVVGCLLATLNPTEGSFYPCSSHTVIGKKARCRASFLRQPPSCNSPHYLVYKFILV